MNQGHFELNQSEVLAAKQALDRLIRKQRVHLYKPIQIAEILYKVRQGILTIDDVRYNLESYRNRSKNWRDEITKLLLDQVSTSSQKYQDNVFEPNAIPPATLAVLAEANVEGVVGRYIYQQFWMRQQKIVRLAEMLQSATPEEFDLEAFLAEFERDPGIKRSIDKAFEIVVYALFNTLVTHLRVQVRLKIDPARMDILKAFEDFTQLVLGIDSNNPEFSIKASLYRAGVTNAADRGVDIWANFGAAVQVKHVTLTDELAEDICENVAADRIIIVCKDSEKETIEKVCSQIGATSRIQGIVIQSQLTDWYERALRGEFASELGNTLLSSLRAEFTNEFPFSRTFGEFFRSRCYDQISVPSSPFWIEGKIQWD
jgi:hypothetical protein